MNTRDIVRNMVAARSGPILLAALWSTRIYIWNTETSSLVSCFDAFRDITETLLALSPSGTQLFAGSYEKHLLRCYDTATGNIVWERNDLGKVRFVALNHCSQTLICCSQDRSCWIVDPSDGRAEKYPTIESLEEDTISGTRFVERKRKPMGILKPDGLRLLKPDGTIINIANETFAVLTACFGDGVIAFSESGGDVRCHSIDDGREKWRYKSEQGRHVLRLAYFNEQGKFYGLEWHYIGGTGNMCLIQIDESIGFAKTIKWFDTLPAYVLSPYDGLFYTYDGQGLDVRTGEVVKQLPFAEVIRGAE